MAPRFDMSRLQTRLLSALVMAPVTLLLIWYGSWPFATMIFVAICVAAMEWRGLVRDLPAPAFFTILGLAYIVISGVSFYLLRWEFSFLLTMYFMVLVWSSDTGAYFAGKFIGGPKMAEAISPNKTWAGFGGATILPGLLAVIGLLSFNLDVHMPLPTDFVVFCAFCVGVLVGVLGQGGDLLISVMKRKAGLKDTGTLIPGHGGLLDRIDSMLPNTIFFLIVAYTVKYAA